MNLEHEQAEQDGDLRSDPCDELSRAFVLVDIDACKNEDSEGDDDSSLSSNSYISTAEVQDDDQDEASQYTYEDSECSDAADHLCAVVEDEATVVTFQSAAATIAKLERKEKALKGENSLDVGWLLQFGGQTDFLYRQGDR